MDTIQVSYIVNIHLSILLLEYSDDFERGTVNKNLGSREGNFHCPKKGNSVRCEM